MEASEDLGLSQVTESSSVNATASIAGPPDANADQDASCNTANPLGVQQRRKNALISIWHFLNSETCSIVCLLLLFINTIQLYLFFLYSLLVMPLHTSRMLRANNLEFIISQLPDSYIDYNFFESLGVL
ncbi:hypothetical protein HG536_0D05810 [Torulaspora globosa]|uniref:Uncharacterized protein n=1 Tax=Torulaspora globosa TaxID=48254 RepID=A0A7G3ZHS4_9SACH|nr:uncharacterized protein HG536_0D05810 [Torulaspora globosa]QLL33060.1 hypothetical protein HG536_0D05810 [Torulaspora globosa]